MITPSFGLTATERVLPKLALDFTIASLDNRITFTRTTSASNPATYVNSNGYVTAATDNQPRFDYDPVTLACKGLLIEESRANIALRSGDFGNVAWTKLRASVSTDQATSPDGTTNADAFIEDSSLNSHLVYSTTAVSLTSGTSYSLSLFVKANGRTQVRLATGSSAPWSGTSPAAIFDISTQIISAKSATVAASSITDYGNGWYRCSLTSTAATATATSGPLQIQTCVAGATSYQGDGTSGLYIWGAQVEAGAFPTSYIPTTTAALTRNADVATMTGANFSDWWQATRGGVLVQAIPSTVSGIRPLVQFDDGTANEIIALRGNTTNPELYIVDGGTPQAQIDAGTIAANTAYSLTGWWQTNFCAARKDSGARVEDLTATIPMVTQARRGSDGTNYLNGHLTIINYYDKFSGQIYIRRKNKVIFNVI